MKKFNYWLMVAYQRPKEKYENNVKECRLLENQAMVADRKGYEEVAGLTMLREILVEQLLPQLKQQAA